MKKQNYTTPSLQQVRIESEQVILAGSGDALSGSLQKFTDGGIF